MVVCQLGGDVSGPLTSLKVSNLKIILSGVVLLTAAVSQQPLSSLQGPELNGFSIKGGLVSKDMPVVDAASPCTVFSL